MTISEWQWRSATTMPPPNGNMGSNSGGWEPTVSSIYFTKINQNNVDQGTMLREIKKDATITIYKSTDSSIYSKWTISSDPTENVPGNYFTFPAIFVESSGSPTTAVFSAVFDNPPVPSEGKVIQIAVTTGIVSSPLDRVYALLDDGAMWWRDNAPEAHWWNIPPVESPPSGKAQPLPISTGVLPPPPTQGAPNT